MAILGAGTIGLLTLIAVRRAGAAKIVSTDMLANKRELALALGADAVVDAGVEDLAGVVRVELGESADVVFDCVANEATLREAIKMAIKGGTVVVLGGPRKFATVDLPVIQEYQIRVQGAATYRWEDFDDAIEIIGGNDFDADRFITATFPLPRAAEAFAAIAAGGEVKILVVADRGTMIRQRLLIPVCSSSWQVSGLSGYPSSWDSPDHGTGLLERNRVDGTAHVGRWSGVRNAHPGGTRRRCRSRRFERTRVRRRVR